MERTTIEQAKLIFGDNFIGMEELSGMLNHLSSTVASNMHIPEVPWSKDVLEKLASNYILILGIPYWGEIDVTIRNLRNIFGTDPNICEPCFYNQDWYLNEVFIDTPLKLGWYLVRKNAYDEARAIDPNILVKNEVRFPNAVLCCYTFFAAWFAYKIKLWEYDFIWCSDKDHNNDRIYVGKYTDIDGINKNGFSIHRHLALRPCYTAIDVIA